MELEFFSPENCKELLRNFQQIRLAFVKDLCGEQGQEWMREHHWCQGVQLKSCRQGEFKEI